MQMIKKMGPLSGLLGMIPGLGNQLKDVEIDDRQLGRVEAMITSMTVKERRNPKLLQNPSRARRIARGSGATQQDVGQEWSNFDFADRCAEAAKAGMKGIGIWHADLAHILETRSHEDIKKLLDDNGLRYLELEFIWGFFEDEGTEGRRESDEMKKLLLEGAAAL